MIVTSPPSLSPIKLHVGAGASSLPGWVNCDLYPAPHIDAVFDLESPWPFADNSAQAVYASHTLEHLHAFKTFFREAWRVLQEPSGMLLRLPYGGHRAAWWDIEHIRPWYGESFCFLQPGYAQAIGNPQHTEWPCPFGIAVVQLRVAAKFQAVLRRFWGRKLIGPWLENIPNAIEELWVHLYPLKSEAAIAEYQAHNVPNIVPQQFVMYRHQWEGRAQRPGEDLTLFPFVNTYAVNGFGA